MSSWSGGSSRRYRAVRALVLARDRYRCKAHPNHCAEAKAPEHQCAGAAPLEGGPGVAGHAHHTKGRAVTGDDPTFMVAACPPCNLAIGEPGARGAPAPRPRTIWR